MLILFQSFSQKVYGFLNNSTKTMVKKICIAFLLVSLSSCWNSAETESIVDNTAEQWPKNILILWDSITEWYGVSESENYVFLLQELLLSHDYSYEVVNGGISGDTSLDLLKRIDNYDNLDIDIAIIAIGWNDGLRQQDPSIMQENIQTVIQSLDAKEKIIAGYNAFSLYGRNYENSFLQAFHNIEKENPELFHYKEFLNGVVWVPRYNQSDLIHPNVVWHTIIAENLFEYLESKKLLTH